MIVCILGLQLLAAASIISHMTICAQNSLMVMIVISALSVPRTSVHMLLMFGRLQTRSLILDKLRSI